MSPAVIVLNFSHPLTQEQLTALEQMAGQKVGRIVDIKTQFDTSQPFAPQTRKLVETVGISPEDWQTQRFVVNLPSLGVIAGLVLAELHGRMGYFPSILRLRPIPGHVPPQFELAETLDLYQIREDARRNR